MAASLSSESIHSLESLPSNLSTLTSLSTLECELIQHALIKLASFEQDPARLLPHPSDLPPTSKNPRVDPHKLLKAMLERAPNEHGQLYVAKAILGCDDISSLVELSNTYLRYLLVPFKGNRSPGGLSLSQGTTPTYREETSRGLDPDHTNRDAVMTHLVRLREGYQCLLSEVYHRGAAPPGERHHPLQVAHIIKRAVGVFDAQKDRGSVRTWDILRNYIGWDAERTQEVMKNLDTPFNGMLLIGPFHYAWDGFAWTLKPVVDAEDNVIPNTYEIEEVHPLNVPADCICKKDGSTINYQIVFKDHGIEPTLQERIPEEDRKFLTSPRPMPDPELIALHRAVCWVLHLSGAAETINSIFEDIEDAGVKVPSDKIRTTDELDILLSSLTLLK